MKSATALGPPLILGAIIVVSVVGLLRLEADDAPASAAVRATSRAAAMNGPASASPTVPRSPAAAPAAGATDAPPAPEHALRNQPTGAPADAVAAAVTELRELYGFAGALDTDATRALIAKRKAATDRLIAQLAAFGAASVSPILDAYAAAEGGHEKLMLIRALAENPSPEAAQGLATLLESEDTFSYRRAILEGLGDTDAPGASALLAASLDDAQDPRERIAAIKALSADPGNAATLIQRLDSDTDVGVRLAAVTRLGQIGGEDAHAALGRLATTSASGQRVRAAAIQALARSFPDRALDVLAPLATDDEVRVRSALITALERLKTDGAVELLRSIAGDDLDTAVRTHAAQALARIQR